MYFLGIGAMTVGVTELAGPGLELTPPPVPMEPGEGLCSTPAGEEDAEETSIFFLQQGGTHKATTSQVLWRSKRLTPKS